MSDLEGKFLWCELMTRDTKAAEAFYRKVMGWKTAPFAGNAGMEYTVLSGADGEMGGIMGIPPEAAQAGAKPCWMGHVAVADLDGCVARITAAGGTLHKPAFDVTGVGRLAVVADPQGAAFMLLQPSSKKPFPIPGPKALGHVAWHELQTTDWKSGLEFYSALFGFRATEAMDMGAMGTYQMFSMGSGEPAGGMMNSPDFPRPAWLFYVRVADIDVAQDAILAEGGEILHGPSDVPGGDRIVQAKDPQGARFAVVATSKAQGN